MLFETRSCRIATGRQAVSLITHTKEWVAYCIVSDNAWVVSVVPAAPSQTVARVLLASGHPMLPPLCDVVALDTSPDGDVLAITTCVGGIWLFSLGEAGVHLNTTFPRGMRSFMPKTTVFAGGFVGHCDSKLAFAVHYSNAEAEELVCTLGDVACPKPTTVKVLQAAAGQISKFAVNTNYIAMYVSAAAQRLYLLRIENGEYRCSKASMHFDGRHVLPLELVVSARGTLALSYHVPEINASMVDVFDARLARTAAIRYTGMARCVGVRSTMLVVVDEHREAVVLHNCRRELDVELKSGNGFGRSCASIGDRSVAFACTLTDESRLFVSAARSEARRKRGLDAPPDDPLGSPLGDDT